MLISWVHLLYLDQVHKPTNWSPALLSTAALPIQSPTFPQANLPFVQDVPEAIPRDSSPHSFPPRNCFRHQTPRIRSNVNESQAARVFAFSSPAQTSLFENYLKSWLCDVSGENVFEAKHGIHVFFSFLNILVIQILLLSFSPDPKAI